MENSEDETKTSPIKTPPQNEALEKKKKKRKKTEKNNKKTRALEFPGLVHRLDSPIKLLAEGLREEFLDGHVEFLRKDDGEAGINVVLQ
jgi:hypothetical protein